MRSAEIALVGPENHLPNPLPRTPQPFSTRPALFAPHPPLLSGGWYRGAGQETLGPGRYLVRQPATKRAGAALLWTLLLGPLGLCYLSATAGITASALTVIVLAVSWNGLFLTVVWPLAMVLAVLVATSRR